MPTALQTYRLCRRCSERQGAPASSFETVPGKECFVCAGVMDRVEEMSAAAARAFRRFEAKTFAVGVSVPEGVQEREDELRSVLKLKGNETIKTQAARLVASQVASASRLKADRQRPDVTLLADFGSREVAVSSRPVFYYGRYTKPPGVSQRRLLCDECRGTGCKKCRGTGFERKASVEELLRSKLGSYTGSENVIITWLGSEDRTSRVHPPGRPFVAEVKNPRKRRPPAKFGVRTKGGLVSVTRGRVLPSRPVRLPQFRFVTRIAATAASRVGPGALDDLRRAFRNAEVRFDRPHNRPTVKRVYRATASARGRKLTIEAELDGGLPVKRFVSGELVSPSVSEVLKTQVGCRSFDIFRVREIGRFSFAEIARNKAKN